MDEQTTFQLLGEEGIARLTAAFYRRVKTDDLLGPMYPADDWEGSEARLRDFLLFRIGGVPRYLEQRGHPRLRMRHAPFAINMAARNQWMVLMERALDEAQFPAEVTALLREFFHNTATFMINRPPG